DPNQTAGLGYNLRVGTSPGAQDIVSTMANLTNGWRRVAQRGNAGQGLSWPLTNALFAGTYYWSVQAIDHSFAGSAFAPEATFTLPPQAPQAQTRVATNLAPTAAELTGSLFPGGAATAFFFEYGLSTNYGSRSLIQAVGTEARWFNISARLTNLLIG